MSLIPAKFYYEEDHSDQWQRKKQTKEEAKNAKLAKLDPDSAKSAKDVMDENARKRKREEGNDDDNQSQSAESELGSELPKEGIKRGDLKSKKQKQIDAAAEKDNKASNRNAEAEERRKLKAEKKAEKKAAQREKKKAKQAAKSDKKQTVDEKPEPAEQLPTTTQDTKSEKKSAKDNDAEEEELEIVEGLDLDTKNSALEDTSSTTSSNPDSSTFEMSNNNSGTSSTSSIVPPSDAPSSETKPTLKQLKTTPDELRQRLQKRLDELRAARRADGLNGKPARTRQELIEARRLKAEERKQHKKELRRKAKEEEEQKKDEEMQRRFSPGGSGSLLASPRSPAESFTSNSNNNFAFGRIAFPDGQHADPTLSRLLDDKSKQGPRDPLAALKIAEAKKTRLSGLDEDKRAEIEEKDMWLNAKKRAHGERVRDDTSLLKKALKRKESAKKKSEREWKERIEGVTKGKEMRQQRREDNIRKRKEDRGSGGGGGKKSGGNNNKGKSKARPGFEGSFKAKNGGGGGKKK
jgi:hypothetical protein